jgi:putative transposase
MAELSLGGAVRGKVKRTTISDPRTPRRHHPVARNFRPLAPDRRWVADFTYVSTWSAGPTRVRYRTRRAAHPRLALTTMTSQLVVDAVGQAIWTRQRDGRT